MTSRDFIELTTAAFAGIGLVVCLVTVIEWVL